MIATIAQQTATIFEDQHGIKNLAVPPAPTIWRDKIQALEEANLHSQRAACIFDMRCWQAAAMGFQRLESPKLVELLMGEPFTDEAEGPTRQVYEWAYDHHTDELLDNSWGGKPTILSRKVRRNAWYLPPFHKTVLWQCQFGKLDYLKREIPYGVVLRITECKELKLFNCFNVLAPAEAWERKTDIDPIVVATIWELPPKNSSDTSRKAGQVAHFFLAQW